MKNLYLVIALAVTFSSCENIIKKQRPAYYPSQDLNIESGNLKHNMIKEGGLFSEPQYDGWILTGDVRNNGAVIYKNIQIEIQYENAQGHKLTEEKFTLNKTVAPGTTADINVKVYPPAEMQKFACGVITASAVFTDGN